LAAADAGEACPAVHFAGQRAKAWAVAAGATDPWASHGPKTQSFFRSIMGATDDPCVDSWAARVATRDPVLTTVRPAAYRRISRAYRDAAAALGVSARDCQAAVWVHVRGSAS
jgi:hypothetical protein